MTETNYILANNSHNAIFGHYVNYKTFSLVFHNKPKTVLLYDL